MKKLLLAGAAALLLTGAGVDHAAARMGAGGGTAHFSGGGGVSSGRVGGGNFSAPRGAVTGNFSTANRGFTGNRSFSGNRNFAARGFTGTRGFTGNRFAGSRFAGRGGHWGWWHGRRHFFPGVAAGVGLGLAFGGPWWGYNDDCVAWDGWRWVNVCVGPTVAVGPGPWW